MNQKLPTWVIVVAIVVVVGLAAAWLMKGGAGGGPSESEVDQAMKNVAGRTSVAPTPVPAQTK